MAPDDHRDEATLARVQELQRLYQRIDTLVDSANIAMGNIVIFLAATLAALAISPLVFLAAPPLWSWWILYAQMKDRDTLKYAALARFHEEELARVFGSQVFVYERTLTSRAPHPLVNDPFIYTFNGIYFVALNAGSWALGFWIIWSTYLDPDWSSLPGLYYFIGYGIAAVVVYVVKLITLGSRARAVDIEALEHALGSLQRPTSDEAPHHPADVQRPPAPP